MEARWNAGVRSSNAWDAEWRRGWKHGKDGNGGHGGEVGSAGVDEREAEERRQGDSLHEGHRSDIGGCWLFLGHPGLF